MHTHTHEHDTFVKMSLSNDGLKKKKKITRKSVQLYPVTNGLSMVLSFSDAYRVF